MNDDINKYVPSLLNPRCVTKESADITLTQQSVISRCSLSLRRNSVAAKPPPKVKPNIRSQHLQSNQENCQNLRNIIPKPPKIVELLKDKSAKSIRTLTNKENSIGVSAIDDIHSKNTRNSRYIPSSPSFDFDYFKNINNCKSVVTVSSNTELKDERLSVSSLTETIVYEEPFQKETVFSVSFGVLDCDNVDVTTKNANVKNFSILQGKDILTVDCNLTAGSIASTYSSSECNENMYEKPHPNPLKRSAISVNLEIKKIKTKDKIEEAIKDKILLLKTECTENLSHVIIQPPNCKFYKKNIIVKNKEKFKRNSCSKSVSVKNGVNGLQKVGDSLKQVSLDAFIKRDADHEVSQDSQKTVLLQNYGDNVESACVVSELHAEQEMDSKIVGVYDAARYEGAGGGGRCAAAAKREVMGRSRVAPATAEVPSHMSSPNTLRRRDQQHSPLLPARCSSSRTPRAKSGVEPHHSAHVASRSPTGKASAVPIKNIPHYKIVAGTHFAVDAFSYGEIPSVKHYFLTHFHSDHYSGLKKTFNKILYCSKITAELCQARLGLNSKCIIVMNVDETRQIDGVDVTAVDANHCPGAIMLVFTLPNGRSILHTGDFRAHPPMESYPVFWNNEIHTIYLDTTYCNPRYDFPTQEESLEMALYLLRQKKIALEKACKKFSSVLIVCGTYTIGKEKFFLGMSRRIGCGVWACPEKERVLAAVEGHACIGAAPPSCQLHVLPMRDITVEKLRQYLDSLNGAFSEVVAFKPSGWENGKNAVIEKDSVTIYGIPYSEHSSFSEMIRFVKFLKPKQVVPIVDITGGVKAVQKFFPCPLVFKDGYFQSRLTDFFSIQDKQNSSAVT